MEFQRQSFSDVVLDLARKYQLDVETIDGPQQERFREQLSRREKLHNVLNLASRWFFNQLNTPNFLNNTLNSSVSYSKTFRGYPSVNLSLTASHSQNTRTQTVNMSLPTFQANVERIYPIC